jgi:prephenate dehydrogenase
MNEKGGIPGFREVGIVGLGLMGGSLARALKALPDPPRIRVLSVDPSEVEAGVREEVIDEAATDEQAFFSGLDLTAYCTPMGATLDLLEGHSRFLDPGTLVTDVVSLKGPLLERAASLGLGRVFVGSHPMAGGEGSGFKPPRPGLFHGARIWVVQGGAPEGVVARIQELWVSLGARPELIDAWEHDRLMVWISHLPQVASNALALALGEEGIPRDQLGPGGKDLTRLAGSSPEMWTDLLEHASHLLPEALDRFEAALGEIRLQIQGKKGDEVAEMMKRTRRWFEGERWS